MNEYEIPDFYRADRGLFDSPFKKILDEYWHQLLYGKPDLTRELVHETPTVDPSL